MSIADEMVDYYSGVSGNYYEKSLRREAYKTMRKGGKRMSKMITEVKVTTVDYGKVQGYASVVIFGKIKLTGIRIIDGAKGYFISMAQKKNEKTGEYNDIFFPLDGPTRMEMQEEIINEFLKVKDGNASPSKPSKPATPPVTPPAPEPTILDDDDDDEFPF